MLVSGAMKAISKLRLDLLHSVLGLCRDCGGATATEFAMIVPVMLLMFFGMVEFTSGVEVDRKLTVMARTLSDLTSRSSSVADNDLSNFFAAGTAVMSPYSGTPVRATISELWINSAGQARVQWSRGASPRAAGTVVAIPSQLAEKTDGTYLSNTYLIFSEVSYQYVPTIGYVMAKAGVNLHEVAYTRPRQTQCVIYPTPASGSPVPACPQL